MRISRISKDEYYLEIAKAVSKRSTCLKRKYGCVIVNNDEIIATGYNGSSRGVENCCDKGICNRLKKPSNSGDYSDCPGVHAEQNAMISAARRDMIGATLYLYGEEYVEYYDDNVHLLLNKWKPIDVIEPCPICKRMLINAGINKIIVKKNRE